jgi:hypothetical protein
VVGGSFDSNCFNVGGCTTTGSTPNLRMNGTGIFCFGNLQFQPHNAVVTPDLNAGTSAIAQVAVTVLPAQPPDCTNSTEDIEVKTESTPGTLSNKDFFININ